MRVFVSEIVGVLEGVRVTVPDLLFVCVPVGVLDRVGVGDRDAVFVADVVLEGVGVPVADEPSVDVGVCVGVWVLDGVTEDVRDCEGVRVRVPEPVAVLDFVCV